MDNFVITIARAAGSGGTTIAKRLAQHYGINYYDKNILKMASEESGINESLFAQADEKISFSNFLKISRKVYDGKVITPDRADFTSDDNLFNYQVKVLKELAESESYIIIGRVAEYVLKDCKNVFKIYLYADEDFCARHEAERLCIPVEEAKVRNAKTNKERKRYHLYYTGLANDNLSCYDLCINTGVVGFDEAEKIIESFVDSKMK